MIGSSTKKKKNNHICMKTPNSLTDEWGTTVHTINQFVKLTRSWCSVIILMTKSALGGKIEGWREKSRRHACLLYHYSYLLRQHWQREKERERGHKIP